MSTKTGALAQECLRESESCLYTSTSFFYWIRFLQTANVLFKVAPLILGAIAGWKLLTTSETSEIQTFAAVCSFFAGLLPTVYAALKLDEYLKLCRDLAGEFNNLQHAFRRAANVSSKKPFVEFEADFKSFIERLEKARSHAVAAPTLCFWLAQWKVKSGNFKFEVDANMAEVTAVPPVKAL